MSPSPNLYIEVLMPKMMFEKSIWSFPYDGMETFWPTQYLEMVPFEYNYG